MPDRQQSQTFRYPWDRFPRLLFQGVAGAFVLSGWHLASEAPGAAVITVLFGFFSLACWAVLFWGGRRVR